jgi:microcompartment protein CcmL/EutN
MAQQALGMIETKGLIAAVEAADAALKAANVQFAGQQRVGSGYVAIMLQGDVSAVKAAVDAGVAAGGKLGQIISSSVIARPHDETPRG